ncbi:MAG: class I SAM-dependent methyltransferase [Rubrivivax sp.]|jgi:SAM-dependent methyltransferase|nr:class I SAM-dependent methyltransferase [Rubrivivax sp.]
MDTSDPDGLHRHRLATLYADRGGLLAIFGPKVADYVASRPDYPPALLDWLAAEGVLRQDSRVVDVGAGTGLLTRDLLARGAQVLAVEPNVAMRKACDQLLGGIAGYRSADGRAEAIPAADASVDLVTAAQAFHWFDVPLARREFARVLVRGGAVALTWNDRRDDDPLTQDVNAVFGRYGGERRDAMLAHENRNDVEAFFAPLRAQQWTGEHQHRLDEAGLLALAFSRSYMPAPDAPDRSTAAAELRAIFTRHARNGQVEVRYRTVCWLGRVTGG